MAIHPMLCCISMRKHYSTVWHGGSGIMLCCGDIFDPKEAAKLTKVVGATYRAWRKLLRLRLNLSYFAKMNGQIFESVNTCKVDTQKEIQYRLKQAKTAAHVKFFIWQSDKKKTQIFYNFQSTLKFWSTLFWFLSKTFLYTLNSEVLMWQRVEIPLNCNVIII